MVNQKKYISNKYLSELLLTLKYPEIPLHNNAAELGAREQVRKRDVSLHTMTEEGTIKIQIIYLKSSKTNLTPWKIE
jgi:hypothetical protein